MSSKGGAGRGQSQPRGAQKAPRQPSPMRIEEVSDSEEASPVAHSGAQQRKPKVANLPPKAGAAAASSGLTALQRKAMQQRNKNSVKGLGGKPPRGGAVQVEDARDSALGSDGEEDEDEDETAGDQPESDSAGDSDNDDAMWETPAQTKARKLADTHAAAAAAAPTPATPASRFPSLSTVLLWLFLLSLAAGLIWIRLQDASLLGPDVDTISHAPNEADDHYAVLDVPRNADLRAIKASYRKMVLLTHPDKNPACADCVERFQKVQKAYDVLSHPDKRSMYDSIETSFDLLASDATELTAANFEQEVLHRDDVWVIQVYTDWHKSAIRFSQAWEEAIQRYGSLVRFGRVHAQREQALVRSMPAKFGVIPTVFVYANGQFSTSKAFMDDSSRALVKLSKFIAHAYPNTVESVPHSVGDIRNFMRRAQVDEGSAAAEQPSVLFVPDFVKQAAQARKAQSPPQSGSRNQRFQQQMLQTDAQSVNEPSLTLKSIARRFQHSFAFGQVEQIREPEQWKAWIKDMSAAFKLTPPSQLPALLYQPDASSPPQWLGAADLNKEKLLKHMDGLHRRLTPWFNSHSYARHCTDSVSKTPTVCVLAVACSPLSQADATWRNFASTARSLRSTAAFKNAQLQFAKVDVARNNDMAPLCAALPKQAQQANDINIVVLSEQELYQYRAADHPTQQLDSWLQHVIKKDGKVQSLPAPYVPVVHIPDDMLPLLLPVFGQVLVPLTWLYGGGILLALWLCAPIISRHFGSFLYILFAMSMALPAYELIKDVYQKHVA